MGTILREMVRGVSKTKSVHSRFVSGAEKNLQTCYFTDLDAIHAGCLVGRGVAKKFWKKREETVFFFDIFCST